VAEVDEYRESAKPVYIRVTAFVERETQKRMVIGKGGRTIKALGRQAREKIEALVGEKVYLDLWIKTLPKWRSDPAQLARFGLVTSHGRNA
jgi:GTP-binding protein Era